MSNQEIQPTILLVENDETTRSSLQMDLQRANYQVMTAGNGCEALAIARKNCPALVITDIFMPKMDGLELIQHFRSTCPATKIIALFKTSGIHYLKMAQLLGADVALRKPFPLATLLGIVEQQIVKNKIGINEGWTEPLGAIPPYGPKT